LDGVMRDQEIVAVDGRSDRAVLQSADIVLGEAPNPMVAAWWIASVFARYPGCLVAAVRHDHGHWCELATRGQEPDLVRPCFGERLTEHDVEVMARARHEGLVAR
jgi:hypothetical protein